MRSFAPALAKIQKHFVCILRSFGQDAAKIQNARLQRFQLGITYREISKFEESSASGGFN